MTIDIIKEVLTIISSTAITVIASIGAALLIYGVKILCSKFGITISSATMSDILSIVSQVIKYLDQKYVDTIKNNSSNGTLTEYQKQMIKEKSLIMLKSILNSEQVEFLLKKYNMEDIDDVLDILVESSIKDSRTTDNSDVIIMDDENDEDDITDGTISTIYTPSPEEIESLQMCPGNCHICTLSKECPICRLNKYDITIANNDILLG